MKVRASVKKRSPAKGIDSGIVEILIVGKKIDKVYLDKIQPKIEKNK